MPKYRKNTTFAPQFEIALVLCSIGPLAPTDSVRTLLYTLVNIPATILPRRFHKIAHFVIGI